MAKLIFKYSTMNSGKTLDLIRTIHNYEENNYKVLVLKPEIDKKGDNKITTRVGLERKVDFLIKETDSIINLLKGNLENIECIFIDEAQFLNEGQVDELFIITKAMDIPVICYGLRNNFKLESFEGSRRLLEISDSLEEFKTLCYCGDIARYAARKVNGKYVVEGDVVVIDGEDNIEYIPFCGKHYLENVTKINLEKIKEDLK